MIPAASGCSIIAGKIVTISNVIADHTTEREGAANERVVKTPSTVFALHLRVQIDQPFGWIDDDSLCRRIDLATDLRGERHQHLAPGPFDHQPAARHRSFHSADDAHAGSTRRPGA